MHTHHVIADENLSERGNAHQHQSQDQRNGLLLTGQRSQKQRQNHELQRLLEIGTDKFIRAYIDNGDKKLDPKHDFMLTYWKAKDAPKNLGSSKKIAMHNYYIAGHPPVGGVVVEYDQLTITSGNYSTSSAQFPHAGWVKALGFDPTNINQSLP